MNKTRIALLIGNGSRVPAIVECVCRIKEAEAVFVLSCIGEGAGTQAAKSRLIKTGLLDWENYRRRKEGRRIFSARTRNLLKSHRADLVVMAGWTVLMPPEFVKEFDGRLVNIHPSILPSHRGEGKKAIQAQWEARWDRDAPPAGCTLHYVDCGMDSGEPIMRGFVYPRDYRSLEEFADAIHAKEDEVLCRGIKKLIQEIQNG